MMINHTSYVFTDLKKHWASGRVEDSRFFAQKHSHCECFCAKEQKRTMLPQAHRASIG
jgi:hypothetical protein